MRHALLALALMIAAPAQAQPERSIAALLDWYGAEAGVPLPTLEAHEVEQVLAGEPVIRVAETSAEDNDEDITAMGVFGYYIVEAPRLLTWLAVMGGNDERDYRLTSILLARGADGAYDRYQHVDLPWPFRDRHWMIACEKNLLLAAASEGIAWEHRWQLLPQRDDLLSQVRRGGRLDEATLAASVYLPANSGAWTLFELDAERTLVVAYVHAELGGRFPRSLVRAFTKSRLRAGLRSIEELAARVHENYSEERLIHDGFGRPITATTARDAAARREGRERLATAGSRR